MVSFTAVASHSVSMLASNESTSAGVSLELTSALHVQNLKQ